MFTCLQDRFNVSVNKNLDRSARKHARSFVFPRGLN